MAGKEEAKLHVVCVPYPAQGHITPMLKIAKLLHSKGFHITFVNTEYNHRRLLRSRGPNSLVGTASFRFETIPDGLPPSDNTDVTQDVVALMYSLVNNGQHYFTELLNRLNDSCSGSPPISLILSDLTMPFTADAARQCGDLPVIWFWSASPCSYMGYAQFSTVLDKGIVPLKDTSYITDGSLDILVDWVPSMKGVPMKYLPTFIWITDKDDFVFQFAIKIIKMSCQLPIIFNTFEALDHEVLQDISSMITRPMYTIGPLHCLLNHVPGDDEDVNSIGSNLWKEDANCLLWLDSKEVKSVVYVSFGSITPLTKEQLVEFAWGLANSNFSFIWIIRPDIVGGDSAIIPSEFLEKVKDRGLLADWCDQEKVLNHPSVGVFLTHCGWNSTLDSLSSGVPIISWPFFADQQTNCWFSCNKWGIGMEVSNDVKRDVVEQQIREAMEGEKGKEIKLKAVEWKRLAAESTKSPCGSSFLNFNKLVEDILSLKNGYKL